MLSTVDSIHGVPIRLTDERWAHITEEHTELSGFRLEVLKTIEKPEKIFAGNEGEHLAARPVGSGKWVVVFTEKRAKMVLSLRRF